MVQSCLRPYLSRISCSAARRLRRGVICALLASQNLYIGDRTSPLQVWTVDMEEITATQVDGPPTLVLRFNK